MKVIDGSSPDKEMRAFLGRIIQCGGSANLTDLPHASYEQNKARIKCKRYGWAYFDHGIRRWLITPAGEIALGRSP